MILWVFERLTGVSLGIWAKILRLIRRGAMVSLTEFGSDRVEPHWKVNASFHCVKLPIDCEEYLLCYILRVLGVAELGVGKGVDAFLIFAYKQSKRRRVTTEAFANNISIFHLAFGNFYEQLALSGESIAIGVADYLVTGYGY